jgi:nucleoside-diphosphate-sugar epimerase
MKVLVTGGVGFIGHNVVAQFEADGHEVCIIDNFTNYGIILESEIAKLHQARLSRIKTTNIYRVDIRNYNAVLNVFNEFQPDMVIHCAAFPRAKAVDQNPEDGANVLTNGLINLLRCSERFSVRRFVYISSSMVYGDFDLYGYEDMRCNPKGIYGILKYAGESLTKDLCDRAGIDHVIIRPSAVYGPYDVEDRVVSKFLINAIQDQELVVCGAEEHLDFTYIDDAIDGIVKASMSFNSSKRTYNITRSRGRSLLEAAELAVSIVGSGKIKIVDANPRFPSRGTLSTIRAGQDFGYRGRVDIEEGFKLYYEWLQRTL